MPTTSHIQRCSSDPLAFFDGLRIPAGRLGTVMADFQRERFTAIAPALLSVGRGEKPDVGKFWLEATKGASKDSDLAACLLWLLAFTRRPLTCQVGAADRDQAAELHKAAKTLLWLNPWLGQRIEANVFKLVCAKTNSEAEIISADVAGSHGARPDVLVLNELSHISKWEFAENLMDNASKVPQGLVVIATNAGFLGSDAFRWRELARTSDRWSFHEWTEPAPWLSAAEIEEARRRNGPARFQRLWQGVWSPGTGDALDPNDIAAAVDDRLAPMTSREAGYGFAAGLDLGVKRDHSALVIVARRSQSGLLRLAHSQSWSPDPHTGKVDLEAVETAVLHAHRTFSLASVWFDPFQAAFMAQRLIQRGVRMHEVPFVGRALDTMATVLLEVFRSRLITLYRDDRLIRDLHRLSIVERAYGHRLEACRDADGHADLATAFALALPAARGLPSWAGQTCGEIISAGGLRRTGPRFGPSAEVFGCCPRSYKLSLR